MEITENKEEMTKYEHSLKAFRDNMNTMNYAVETAVESATVAIAKEGLKSGLEIEMVAKITKLSIEEVTKIAEALKNEQ